MAIAVWVLRLGDYFDIEPPRSQYYWFLYLEGLTQPWRHHTNYGCTPCHSDIVATRHCSLMLFPVQTFLAAKLPSMAEELALPQCTAVLVDRASAAQVG